MKPAGRDKKMQDPISGKTLEIACEIGKCPTHYISALFSWYNTSAALKEDDRWSRHSCKWNLKLFCNKWLIILLKTVDSEEAGYLLGEMVFFFCVKYTYYTHCPALGPHVTWFFPEAFSRFLVKIRIRVDPLPMRALTIINL